MHMRGTRSIVLIAVILLSLQIGMAPAASFAQSPDSSSSSSPAGGQAYVREKTPTLVDPAGPTISLISAEPIFDMAAALNVCGYDEGLATSAPERKRVRDEIAVALGKSGAGAGPGGPTAGACGGRPAGSPRCHKSRPPAKNTAIATAASTK